MKKRSAILIAALLVAVAIALLLWRPWGEKPYRTLQADEIASAQVQLLPPDVTIELTESQIVELVQMLRQLTIYRRDESGREYCGQLVQYTLTRQDGTVHTVGAYAPFVFLDDNCYRANSEILGELSNLGNALQ